MPLRQVPREEEGQGERRGEEKGRVDKAKPGDEPKKLEPQATVNPTIPTLCIATMKKIKTATITEFAAQCYAALAEAARTLHCSEYARADAPTTTPQPRFPMEDRRMQTPN